MKQFLVASTLALAVLAASEQKAQAWKKFNFNVGMNISYESANNGVALWGLFNNGPTPSDYQQGGYGGGQHQYFSPHAAAPYSVPGSLPAPAVAQPQPAVAQPRTQQIGYWQYSQYHYQVPHYWYGN